MDLYAEKEENIRTRKDGYFKYAHLKVTLQLIGYYTDDDDDTVEHLGQNRKLRFIR